MIYESPYGKPEGLRDRLAEWVKRLSEDPALPWIGLGLIADLNEAVRQLGSSEITLVDWPAIAEPNEVLSEITWIAVEDYDL